MGLASEWADGYKDSSFAPDLAETSYYAVACSVVSRAYAQRDLLWISIQRDDSDWMIVSRGSVATNPSLLPSIYGALGDVSWFFSRYPSDPDSGRSLLETSRVWRDSYYQRSWNLWMLVTYHSQTFAVAGDVTGYAGDGDDIPVRVYNATTGALLTSGLTTAGAFSLAWYSDQYDVYVEAEEDATHFGRSATGTAGTDTFDIAFGGGGGGGGGTTSYYMRGWDSGSGGRYVTWGPFTDSPASHLTPSAGDTTPNYTGTLSSPHVYEIVEEP